MARQNAYRSLTPVDHERVRAELHKHERLVGTHEAEKERLREELKEAEEARGKSMEQLLTLIRADANRTPVYELKVGTLTIEPPDAQGELLGE